ncbi:MAG: hypothetical protein IJM25_06715 [Eubacterium sp.]|nr:hypothetical protein [Eubacterium sp.]
MKKLLKKLKTKRKNRGSGIVLVVVAVAFIGILVGSLLTAVGYAYRLKLYDYNAKDNFYYLEQAMDEVYAGVGNQTLACMQTAYTDVVNQMVEYSEKTKNYITRDPAELNKEFKRNFMYNVANSDFMKSADGALDTFLQSFITNSDVVLVTGQAKVIKYVMNGDKEEVAGIVAPGTVVDYSSIVIKNVMLKRTAKYNRSSANGEFTQTISTDIVINQPDFEMNFTSINMDYSTLYDYTMLADSGIEITQNKAEMSISGNIYAAADFYDKGYNNYSNGTASSTENSGFYYNLDSNANGRYFTSVIDKSGSPVTPSTSKFVSSADIPSVVSSGNTVYNNFHNGKVSNNVSTSLRNDRLFYAGGGAVANYDGVQETSMNSGLYIKGANVNMQASELIVPGTIAVMDGARFTLYGKTGSGIGESDVWTDNVVLGGVGTVDAAPYALLRANMHVRDDMELNANYSFFQLAGRYYGFGDSTTSDSREYVPTVVGDAANAYFYKTVENGVEKMNARGHYNSSAIVINGQQSKLELSEVDALFVGGRTYIQLSKDYGNVQRKRVKEIKENSEEEEVILEYEVDENGQLVMKDGKPVPITEKSYVFDGNTDDFKTGESISIKTNQLAYVPMNITGASTVSATAVTKADGTEYYMVTLPNEVQSSYLFLHVLGAGFGTDGKKMVSVPCIKYETKDGTEYYYDFQTCYELFYQGKNISHVTFPYTYKTSETASPTLKTADLTINSAEDLAKQFIIYYYTEISNYDASSCRTVLKDIGGKYEGFNFDEGYLNIPTQKTNVYSSGAITAKSGTEFTIEGAENLTNALQYSDPNMGEASEYSKMQGANAFDVAGIADDMEERYAYVKWTLENYNPLVNKSVAEMTYVKDVLANGEQYLTPINRYLNMNQISATTDIHPANGFTAGQTLELQSGYSVWISDKDVVISSTREDGIVQGIVVTKGNVFFDNTVTKFEGLIVSGDKIFVDNLVQLPSNRSVATTGNSTITSISASPEVVRAILNECMMMIGDSTDNGTNARKVLSVFKSYENYAYATGDVKTIDVSYKTIDTIQYSDVVRYSNWMKNVADVPKAEPATTGP